MDQYRLVLYKDDSIWTPFDVVKGIMEDPVAVDRIFIPALDRRHAFLPVSHP